MTINHSVNLIWLALVCGVPFITTGCSKEKFQFVPVEGVVTVDGQPAAFVTVIFRAQPDGDSVITGGSSRAKADANGHYKLRSIVGEGKVGAVVGQHLVKIRGKESLTPADTDENKPTVSIPEEYSKSGVTFLVPDSGTMQADFAITSSP
ncbi:transthyretin-like family protein [Calycomorphotria hydatis]|uniref:Carboxypeptidase regulatory-like domain-containing protein n=1 Tax=Calycomorphotria hydatis TaxID=2528027 RepID=A0A517TAS1_9PLAN|nr:hypothetical protein [Calycomorphotria hydatis]QDT65466.1 hypothetical protein V22_27200 [Calycomorphotria hydatis]